MLHATGGPVVEVEIGATAGDIAHVAVHQLAVEDPAVVGGEIVQVDAIDQRVTVRVSQIAAKPAHGATTASGGVFVEKTPNGEVAALGFHRDAAAIQAGAPYQGIVF